jgi:2-polyprenyl-3-methyl-5-hydroxy-6-metoxy-1,4-benzoquinol methylase
VKKRDQKRFYEEEAKRMSHQEVMYLKGNKHELWWHRKRLVFIFSFLSEIFEESRIMTFLDVGCAEGFYLKHAASAHGEALCIGVDIARTYVEKAKKCGKTLNTEYVVCDVENLPFKDGSIDVVLCSEVLEHVHNYRGALAELFTVAKKYLVISFPGHSYLYRVMDRIVPMKKIASKLLADVGHVSEVTIKDVQTLLRDECRYMKIEIGGALPLQLFEMIPSVGAVDALDNILCKALEYFGAIDDATIHVLEIVKTGTW